LAKKVDDDDLPGDEVRTVYSIPRRVSKGRVLCHNHVVHDEKTPPGERGFRAWTAKQPPKNFKPCDCGWSGLLHYSLSRKPRQKQAE
jgi:hypothetical protein